MATGVYAPNGSLLVEVSDGLSGNGVYNPSGNLRVTLADSLPGLGVYAPDGSLRVSGISEAAALLSGETNGLALDFVSLTAAVKDTTTASNNYNGAISGKLTYTSPFTKWIRGSNGLFSSGTTLRCEYDVNGNPLGILVEHQRINIVRHNRDLSNAAWTKTNVTATKNQAGIDGVANSASSITASAGNGTVLQAITDASIARYQTAFVKRLVGTGTLEMTMDNGTTWTAVTVTSVWSRVSIPTQTLANPTVGFRIGTSGDSFAIDFVQTENGTYETSPIATTTASVIRTFDNISIATSLFPISATECTLYSWSEISPAASGNISVEISNAGRTSITHIPNIAAQQAFVGFDASVTQHNITFTAFASGIFRRIAGSAKAADFRAASDGSLGTPDAVGTFQTAAYTVLKVGNIGSNSGVHDRHIKEIVYLPRSSTNDELRELSSPKLGIQSDEVRASVHLLGDSFLNNLTSDNTYRTGLTNKVRTITKDGVGGSSLADQANRYDLTPYFYGQILVIVDGGLTDTLVAAQTAILDILGHLDHDHWLYLQGGLDADTRSTGMANRLVFDDVNNWVLATFGIKHWVETKSTIQALNNGSANDLTDLAGDAWPRSVSASGLPDDVHLSSANEPIYHQLAVNKILANGW